MDLEHPADHIIHGCTYNITFQDKNTSCQSQSWVYRVPGKFPPGIVDIFTEKNVIEINFLSQSAVDCSFSILLTKFFFQRK